MLDGEHKSIQPMAKHLPSGNEYALHHFITDSPWDHLQIQSELIKWNQNKHKMRGDGVLILDDTSLPKKGKHSVGVSRHRLS